MYFYIGSLSLNPAEWLMNHHTGMWQGITFALCAGRQQDCSHTRRLTDTICNYIRFDIVHCIQNC